MIKLRILQDADLPTHRLRKNTVVTVEPHLAAEWIACKLAEVHTPKAETTSAPPAKETRRGRATKRD